MLRPDPAQRHRPIEIRDDLIARITEAEQEGWLGEIEGLQVSLASEEEKLPQLESERERQCKVPTQLRDLRVGSGAGPWPHWARRPTRRTLR